MPKMHEKHPYLLPEQQRHRTVVVLLVPRKAPLRLGAQPEGVLSLGFPRFTRAWGAACRARATTAASRLREQDAVQLEKGDGGEATVAARLQKLGADGKHPTKGFAICIRLFYTG